MVFYPTAVGIDPSGDTTGTIDTAAINAVTGAGKAAVLGTGTYYVTNLTVESLSAIIGNGPGTILQAVSGTTGYMIALKTPASTQQVTIRDLTLIPNTGTLGGINLDNTGFTTAGLSDGLDTVANVTVQRAGGDSFRFDNTVRELRVTGCKAYWGGGYGFYIGPGSGSGGCTDSHFTDCTAGQTVNHGFNLAGSNNFLTACKAFWSGYNHAAGTWGSTACGFELASGSQNNVLANCSAQQSALHGYDLQSCSYTSLVGCEADTNSAGNGVTTGVGINTNGATNCVISACSGVNYGSLSPGAQKYGIQVAGTQTGTWFIANTVTGATGLFNYVSGFGYTTILPNNVDFGSQTFVKIPSPVLTADGAQTLTSSGTILTSSDGNFALIPVTEAGNVTGMILEAPANSNSQVTIVNKANFTITFAASGTSHVADGTSDVIPALAGRSYVYESVSALWYRLG